MPQSLARNLIHVVFSTKNRKPLISPAIRSELHAYLGGIFRDWESPSIAVGSVADHVHILFSLSKNHALRQVIEEVKRASSKWIKTKDDSFANFYWQNGYGAFSVSQSNVERVTGYIENQEAHHRTMTFQDEFRALLKRHGIEYDERYVWD